MQPELAQQGCIGRLHQRRGLCLCILGVAACLSGTGLAAQEPAGQDHSAATTSVATFHAATNLVRIPVLVLTPELERLPAPIAPNRFAIQIGDAPPIRPKYVRQEGDDAIDVAFVVDTRSLQEDLLSRIDEAIAKLAPSSLRAGDRVSIYAIDCAKMHAVENVSGSRLQLKSAVDVALSSWTERKRLKKKPPCSAETHLWDGLGYVTGKISRQPGWRAIIVVTNGDDRKSKHSLEELTIAAEDDQVAIFGLDSFHQGRPGQFPVDPQVVRLTSLCERSGGLRLELSQSSVAKRMQQIMQMLRERYILEFPRPPNMKPGNVPLLVGIDHSNAFIRAAGDEVPITDEAAAAEFNPGPEPSPAPLQIGDNSQVAAAAPDASPTTHSETPPPQAQQPAPVLTTAQPSAAVPAAGPQPQPGEQAKATPPLFKAITRLTIEDVTVTDARHIAVNGLAQSDFLIKEDGKQQAIRNFEENGPQVQTEQPSPSQMPANVFTNAKPPTPTGSAVNILLFDDVNTGLVNGLERAPENVVYAKEQSLKYLGSMPEGTQVAIFQMDSTLQVLQDFTSDQAVLLAGMKSVKYKPVEGTYVMRGSNMSMACAAANLQSELTVNALVQAAAFLSGIKGRKNLIWFTPGTPWLFEYSTFSRVPCLNDYTQPLHKAYALLTAAEIAVYPIDPRGIFGNPAQSAAFEPNLSPQNSAAQQAAFGGSVTMEHDALRDIADVTGGVPFFNRNDLDAAMKEAIQTGEDYYSLSYVPPLSKYDGKYHTIEVKVDRPDLHLQYRAGYTSVDPAMPLGASEHSAGPSGRTPRGELLAAMGHGDATSTQLIFDVRVMPSIACDGPCDSEVIGAPSPALKRRPLVRYDFSFSMAPNQITLLENPDGTRKGSIDFVFVAYDGAGQELNVVGKTVKLTLQPDEVSRFMQRPFQTNLKFDLPQGDIFVRLGVMDVASGKMGILEIPEKVAK